MYLYGIVKRRWTNNNIHGLGNTHSRKQDKVQNGNIRGDLVRRDENFPTRSQFKPIIVKSKSLQEDYMAKEAKEKDVKSLRLEVERIVSEINMGNEKLAHIMIHLSEMENAM